RGQLIVSRTRDHGPARTRLDRLTHRVDLREIACAERRDDGAPPRQLDHEPFTRELADRLPDRPAARAETPCQLRLDALGPAGAPAAQNRPAHALCARFP